MASPSDITLKNWRVNRESHERNGHPIPLADPFYGFAARIITGVIAIVAVTMLALVWGFLNGWIITSTMLFSFFLTIFFIILLGEHIRSRSFEKTYNLDRLRFDEDFKTDIKLETTGEDGFKVFPRRDRFTLVTKKKPNGRYIKSVFERSYAAIGLFLLMPLLIGVAACILVEDGGPLLVRRKYALMNGSYIVITSFRTSNTRKENDKTTLVGKYLVKTSIDVLPRLYDVALGKITLFGPLGIGTYGRYRDDLVAAGLDRDLKPAITGYSTLAIIRREARGKRASIDSRTAVALVLAYERNWAFRKDLILAAKILRSTIFGGAGK